MRPGRAQIDASRARLRARLIEEERHGPAGFGHRQRADVGRRIGYLILGLAIALIIVGIIAS